jgi:PAS domain S-box/diguanylate cyclase (GGDEF) domain
MIREVDYATYAVDHRDNLRIISFNDYFTKLTGFTAQDVYAGKMTLRDLIPPSIWEEYMIAVNRASKTDDGSGYFEHPILCKDGNSLVVLCYGRLRDDGSDVSDILITDITSHIEAHNAVVQQEKELRLLLKKLSIISERKEEYTVDYNYTTDHFDITIIKNGEARNIYSVDNYLENLYQIPTIHPDDLEDYANILRNLPNLKEGFAFDFRSSLFTEGKFCWYRTTYAPYHDKETDETHIIGRIVNIDEEVMRNQELKRQAQIDTLTSLYNQGTSRNKIDEIALQNPENCINAFIIMDLDNFKYVNDNYGHIRGDDVLKHVGKTLRQFFKFGTDIIGRLGGDEFVIFMRDVPSISRIKKYCNDLCHELSKPLCFQEDDIRITISVGIAIQNNGPDSFDHLYKCADDALYQKKKEGKNGFCFYRQTKN